MTGAVKQRVDTAAGEVTIVVSRHGVHALGSNGWDFYLWAFSWIVRVLRRDRKWQAAVRAGGPRMLSGTQDLLYAEEADSREDALIRARHLQVEVERGSWSSGAVPTGRPSFDWLQPMNAREGLVRIVAVISCASLMFSFTILGERTPGPVTSVVLGALSVVAITTTIGAANMVSRRRHGGRGFVFQAFAPRRLIESAELLGIAPQIARSTLTVAAVSVLVPLLIRAFSAL